MAEAKPSEPGTYYGETSALDQWIWTGTGLPDDDWSPVAGRPVLAAAPVLAGDEMAVGPAAPQVEPLANPSLASLMLTCPKTWQGDHGMLNWVTGMYNAGLGSVPQTSPPTLTAVSPAHVKANTSPTVTLTGTGFVPATVKVQVIGTQLTPVPTPTSTSMQVVITPSLIPTPGSLVQLSAVNGTGAISNAVNLYID